MLSTPNNILVVEDSKAEAFLLAETIKRFQPLTKIDVLGFGGEVIPFLKNTKTALPNLIILDIILPDSDGKEVLKSIKSHPKFSKIPIIVRSGFKGREQANNCFKLGANWFFEKTGDLDLLEKQIEEVLSLL